MDTIASTAEDKLLTSQYHGERPRYDFKRHVSVHQKAHIDIEKATGTPLSGRDKVRRFLTTIKAPHMAVAVSTVLAQQNMRHDFDECINFLRQYIVKRGANPTVNIAMAVTQDSPSSSVTLQPEELNIAAMGGVKRKVDDDTQPLPKVENHWYKKKEFRRLLKAGLGDKLRKIREAARERDEAVEHEKATTKKDEPSSGRKLHKQKGKPNDAKGSRD